MDYSIYRKEIKREVDNIAALPYHSNLLRYSTSMLYHNDIFIVSEYIHGHAMLHEVPLPDGPSRRLFSVKRILSWAQQMFSGLARMHAIKPHPMIHRSALNCNNCCHLYMCMIMYTQGLAFEKYYDSVRRIRFAQRGYSRHCKNNRFRISGFPVVGRI